MERKQTDYCEAFFDENLGGFWASVIPAQPGQTTWVDEHEMESVSGIEELERALAVDVQSSGVAPESVYGSYGFESASEASATARDAVEDIAAACIDLGVEIDPERVEHAQRRAGERAKFQYKEFSTGSAAAEPEPSAEPSTEPEPAPDADRLTTLAPTLAERGLSDGDVAELGRMADATGYGLGPGTALSFEQAVDFAYVMVGACEETVDAAGWTARVDQDVLDGAPRSDAEQMNGYVRDTFCPKIN